jgi:putative transposase
MCPKADHRSHKGLNNRVENARQPTRRKEKILIKFKSPNSAQSILSLMGKVRNIFAVDVGRYTKLRLNKERLLLLLKQFGMKLLKGFLLPKI